MLSANNPRPLQHREPKSMLEPFSQSKNIAGSEASTHQLPANTDFITLCTIFGHIHTPPQDSSTSMHTAQHAQICTPELCFGINRYLSLCPLGGGALFSAMKQASNDANGPKWVRRGSFTRRSALGTFQRTPRRQIEWQWRSPKR